MLRPIRCHSVSRSEWVFHLLEMVNDITQLNRKKYTIIHVAVNFLFQLIFIFLLFLGMVMYANEF